MKYTPSHEWIAVSNQQAKVGISHYAQRELGDIVYVELPQVGKQVKKGQVAAVLESTKAAADVYAPVSGKITGVNVELTEEPELINSAPESEGWIFQMELSNPSELDSLLTGDSYEQLLRR
jgi:glycine cleavage system H protein